jgi:hypothetical protein
VDECNATASCANAGHLVNQPVPGGTAGSKRGVEVLDAVADVVDSRPASGKETADRAFEGFWGEELDIRLSEREADDRRAVDRFARVGRDAQHITVERDRCLEIRDSDADMGNAGMIGHGLL